MVRRQPCHCTVTNPGDHQVVEFSGLSRAAAMDLLRAHGGDPMEVLNHLFP